MTQQHVEKEDYAIDRDAPVWETNGAVLNGMAALALLLLGGVLVCVHSGALQMQFDPKELLKVLQPALYTGILLTAVYLLIKAKPIAFTRQSVRRPKTTREPEPSLDDIEHAASEQPSIPETDDENSESPITDSDDPNPQEDLELARAQASDDSSKT